MFLKNLWGWILCALGAVIGQANVVSAKECCKVQSIVLLNPMKEFGDRSPGPETIAAYIKVIEKEVAAIAETHFEKDKKGRTGLVAIAIRENNQAKFWVDIDGETVQKITNALQSAMQPYGAPKVSGPVAF